MLCFYILGWIKAYVRPQPVKVIELLEGELVQNAPGLGVFLTYQSLPRSGLSA